MALYIAMTTIPLLSYHYDYTYLFIPTLYYIMVGIHYYIIDNHHYVMVVKECLQAFTYTLILSYSSLYVGMAYFFIYLALKSFNNLKMVEIIVISIRKHLKLQCAHQHTILLSLVFIKTTLK